ncbi:hypothetical protein D9615_002612 [Tricholomella constricta]|uniref:Major facilitator superfamily (MFS) profile domain-containing protein n=1 Tax=Tricholomella constricta TaxID=117010 RepID=A0A8H5HN77_9AGAR|nr:hypothetical protein D9615_002612 [Tricholomella constricta]
MAGNGFFVLKASVRSIYSPEVPSTDGSETATVLVACAAYFYMHDYPATAKFLTPEERQTVLAMLKEDSQGLATHYDRKFVWQAMKDYKTYIQMGIYLGLLLTVYAIALFAPTIVKELGYTAAHAQLLTVPIFVAGCITTLFFGWLSDRYVLRGPVVIGCVIVSMIGFIVLYTQEKPGAAYAGAVIAAMGAFPTIAIDLAWAGSAVGGDVRKGTAIQKWEAEADLLQASHLLWWLVQEILEVSARRSYT